MNKEDVQHMARDAQDVERKITSKRCAEAKAARHPKMTKKKSCLWHIHITVRDFRRGATEI